MKNKIAKLSLISILLLTSSFILVEAKGSKKKDVWWEKVDPGSPTEGMWKAHIRKMENGVVHEWRYEWNGEPVKVHLIYKPVALFPNQPGEQWIHWTFDDRYFDLPSDEADLVDYFTRYQSYWVRINRAVI